MLVPELYVFVETAMRFVGGTRDVVFIVRRGGRGFDNMVRKDSLSRCLYKTM